MTLDLTNHPELEPYYLAPSGENELSAQWRDKPHRLVYDLIKMAVERSGKDRLGGYLAGLATAKDIIEKAYRDLPNGSSDEALWQLVIAKIQQEIDHE